MIWRDEKQRWEVAPCGILLVWTHISRCSSPFSWWNLVTSSPPPDFLQRKRPWPWGRVTIRCLFWGALILSWYQKSSRRYPKKNQWCVSQKKVIKGFYHCFMEFGTGSVFEPNCGWFGARFLLPNMGVGIQIVGLGMFSCYEWSLFCW